MWPLHQRRKRKVPVKDKAHRERRRRRRIYLRSSTSSVASFPTTILNVLKGRRTIKRSRIMRQNSQI